MNKEYLYVYGTLIVIVVGFGYFAYLFFWHLG